MAETIGSKLKFIRNSLNMTQENLAFLLCFEKNTYKQYESGRRIPRANIIIYICLKLGISSDFLLGLSDDIIIRDVEKTIEKYEKK